MAKNAKKQPISQGKPITAFFTRASKGSQPPSSQDAPTSSQVSINPSSQPVKTTSNPDITNKELVADVSRPGGSESSRMASRRSERKAHLQASSSVASLKRSLSPDAQAVSTPVPSRNIGENHKTPERRKSKFDSDSDVDSCNGVIYVKSTSNAQMRKKARMSSPEVSARSSSADVVPSSQSDEEELGSTRIQLNSLTELPRDRKKQVLPLTPHQDGEEFFGMTVDEDPASDERTSSPSEESIIGKQAAMGSQIFGQTPTPPLSDAPSIPPTPIALDQASKTAKIIADIKARAYAKSLSSPEATPLAFDEELDSSDDEDFPILTLPSRDETSSKSNGIHSAAASKRPATRYLLRNRSSSPMDARPPVETATRVSRPKAKKTAVVPFAALLKEKTRAKKRGDDEAAIQKAEQISMKYGRDDLIHEMDEDEDEEEADWANAKDISSFGMRNILKSRTIPKESSESDISIAEEDREQLFGEDGGKSVLEILEHDRIARRNATKSEKVSGIQLWSRNPESEDAAMMVDIEYQLPSNSAVIRLFNSYCQRGDLSRATMLLNTNLMLSVNPADRASVASDLCDMALSLQISPLAEAAARCLENFWSSSIQPTESVISFAGILILMKRMGVEPSILGSQLWEVNDPTATGNVGRDYRDPVIRRLLALVVSCARSQRLRCEEVPDIVLALVLVGMDSSTSAELLRDISGAIDLTVPCLSYDDPAPREKEFPLCLKLLACAASYEPINKLRLVSLLSNGGGSTRRIANFTAYCIITEQQTPTLDLYVDCPPLSGVLEQLEPHSRSSPSPPGKFALHDNTDYIDLGFFVGILGIAVSNLKGYTANENVKSQATAISASPTKNMDKPKTELQLLHQAMERLHSSISDNRATHLERSRTKAHIKGLAMNIYYQRDIWLRNNREAKSKTLAQYFQKKT